MGYFPGYQPSCNSVIINYSHYIRAEVVELITNHEPNQRIALLLEQLQCYRRLNPEPQPPGRKEQTVGCLKPDSKARQSNLEVGVNTVLQDIAIDQSRETEGCKRATESCTLQKNVSFIHTILLSKHAAFRDCGS